MFPSYIASPYATLSLLLYFPRSNVSSPRLRIVFNDFNRIRKTWAAAVLDPTNSSDFSVYIHNFVPMKSENVNLIELIGKIVESFGTAPRHSFLQRNTRVYPCVHNSGQSTQNETNKLPWCGFQVKFENLCVVEEETFGLNLAWNYCEENSLREYLDTNHNASCIRNWK